MAFLSGTTLMGGEVDDELRGRAFAFVQTGTRVVLVATMGLSAVVVGLGGSRQIDLGTLEIPLSSTRILLALAGICGVVAGMIAFGQMDDKPGVPILAELISSLRGRPFNVSGPHLHNGVFVVFEGGDGAGKTTQADRLVAALRAQGREVVATREPGATVLGTQLRSLLLDQSPADPVTPRAEALLYAADKAHHVASVIRPALDRGAIVVCDRFIDSSLAYQGAGRTLPVDDISWLSTWAPPGSSLTWSWSSTSTRRWDGSGPASGGGGSAGKRVVRLP